MNEVEKKVKIGLWRQRIGYGSSDFACNLIWQMISLYLLYFYTNVMHLNAGAVSIMFLVTKFIDGISDLIVGFLILKDPDRYFPFPDHGQLPQRSNGFLYLFFQK